MPSNREAYFEAIKLGVPKPIVDFTLREINGFNYLELTRYFEDGIKDYSLFKESIARYLNGEMIEYIFNKAFFLGSPFYVDKNVLIPRQETEQLVLECEKIIQQMFDGKLNIADVCCGSGAIGLSLNRLLPGHNYYLSDISKEAIRVSKMNANSFKILDNTQFIEGDMLKPFLDLNIKLDVIVCNPPYIENVKTIDKRTFEQEPHLALLASPCTKYYEELLKDSKHVLRKRHLIAFEIGEDMEESMRCLILKYYQNDEFFFQKDIYGKTRFLFIKHR